jgi:hypothetical protein
MLFLGGNFDQVIALRSESLLLRAHNSNKAVGGDPAEFDGFNQV